jgi:hypothetical protein
MITAKSLATGGLGRMGNQMFTIAGCIGIAVKSGQPYAFPEWKTHDNAIFGQPVDNINDHLLKPLPPLASTAGFMDYGYFWGYRDVYLPNGNWSIDAHMQSDKFFKHCLPLIRETFTFKDEYPQNEFTAIHVRFGDYIQDENAYHPVCSYRYYCKAMAELKYNDPSTNFWIFTDDRAEARHMFGATSDRIISENYIHDFKLMKSCKSFITANSSFSLMAAILGDHPDKKIICPKRWFGSQAGDIETKDLYPENAIII